MTMKLKLQGALIILFCSLLISEVYFASQVYIQASNVSISKEVFNLEEEKNNVNAGWRKNVQNATFNFTNHILNMTCERENNETEEAFFDVHVSLNALVKSDLNLNYSIFPSELNLETDAAYISLFFTNGSHFVTLTYVVGYKEKDQFSNKTYHIFYQVGNDTRRFQAQRNIRNDLTAKNLSLTGFSWIATNVTFGIVSHGEVLEDTKYEMKAYFDTLENSLYYENLTLANVIPNMKVSWLALYIMAANILIFSISAFGLNKLLKTKKRA